MTDTPQSSAVTTDVLDADPNKEDEVRISFRRYTKTQMDDVIYE